MGSVKLENVTKIFPSKIVAVNNINLYLPDFGINDSVSFILLDPSGCGKQLLQHLG